MEKTIEELICEETELRLKEMSSPDYLFPERAGRRDAVGGAALAGACLVLILLCMTGVIV